ncbi:aldo/keto reductase [Pseudomonas putida S11]|nr:aldo/keto reductase [Pseudomonas putida S11]
MPGAATRCSLVSKVYPHNASLRAMAAACERSLTRLGTDCIDLYLLHWRGQHPTRNETRRSVRALARARQDQALGCLPNFDVDDLRELHNPGLRHRTRCCTTRVQRGIDSTC